MKSRDIVYPFYKWSGSVCILGSLGWFQVYYFNIVNHKHLKQHPTSFNQLQAINYNQEKPSHGRKSAYTTFILDLVGQNAIQ